MLCVSIQAFTYMIMSSLNSQTPKYARQANGQEKISNDKETHVAIFYWKISTCPHTILVGTFEPISYNHIYNAITELSFHTLYGLTGSEAALRALYQSADLYELRALYCSYFEQDEQFTLPATLSL